MPSFIPLHYDIHAWTLAEARRFLDAKHQLGWRVAMMVPQAGTRKDRLPFRKDRSPQESSSYAELGHYRHLWFAEEFEQTKSVQSPQTSVYFPHCVPSDPARTE